ncbi:hypothetical protein PENVUL_c048G06412 [Penicillium vulpinum]|uniref:Uncharacterized protein n=1 Tax=Penicillium vulpinum TaxID=29845 RepID=A0A1V6RGK9_9EURO|nr:hypothetical protein PENVUL_c048G06412 [Penicillium vulpinum]
MSSCNFNCSAPTPALSPNSDITGIGIITNNIVTAGLAIVIISLHYVTVYDETRDPFQKAGQSFRPNPIDESSLKLPKLIIRPLFENGKKGKFSNFLIKVAWLITAFAFGISRLIGTIYRPESMGLEASLTGFNDWSFGQVTAMVLLVAPLITILEYFQDDKQDEPRIQDESRAEDEEQPLSDDQPIPPPELPAISSLAAMDSNDPDNDWIFHPNISDLIMTHLSTLISGVIIWTAHRDPLGKMNETLLDGYLMFAGIGMVVLILCSLMVETIFTESGPSLQLAEGDSKGWITRVSELRRPFRLLQEPPKAKKSEIFAAIRIGCYFPQDGGAIPVAIMLLTLKPRKKDEGAIMRAFAKWFSNFDVLLLRDY